MGDLRERRWRRRVQIGAMVLVAVAVVLGGLVGMARDGSDVSWVRIALLLVVTLVLMGVVWWVVGWLRKRNPRTFGRSPLWDLERPERKEVVRAINRGTDLRPELRDVAARTARQMTRMKSFLWLYFLLALLSAGNGVFLQDGVSRWLGLGVGLCFLLAGLGFARQVKRARVAEQRFG